MDLVLDPPRGVAPVRLGMTLDEAVAAVSEWGEPQVFGPYAHTPVVNVDLSLDGVGFQILLEEEDRVTAIELWWPGEGKQSSTRVLLAGEDVFTTPARQILEHAVARGWAVEDALTENPVIPGVSLGFTRQTSQEMPRDTDGRIMYFTSVLVGGEDTSTSARNSEPDVSPVPESSPASGSVGTAARRRRQSARSTR